MIKKEEFFVWVEKYSGLVGLCALIVGLIGTVITIILAWRLIGKMLIVILLFILMAIFSCITIKSTIFLIRKPLKDEMKNLKSNFEEEKEDLQSGLEEKTKQYDGLIERIKLPKTFDRAITVEIRPKWGKSQIAVTHNPGDKFPSLYFDMKVVNRTCIYSFEAEEIEINCFCGEDPVCSNTWNKKIGQPKPEAFDEFSDFPKFEDGTIEFHILLTKLYNNLEKWYLRGTVKYRSKEPLIDNNQYANPEIDIELEYVLSEKQISELKKEVDKALGADIR